MKSLLMNKLNKDKEKFEICQKELLIKKKSSMNFNFPETPPRTPQDQEEDYWRDVEQNWLGTPAPTPISGPPRLFDYDRDFPPLSRQPIVPEAPEPRETSFLFPEGSLSPLRNKLPNIAPLPSRPSVDNFSRPITEMTDEKNNTISITPKKPIFEPTGQRQLSEQLQGIFPDVDEIIKKESETFKERNQDLDKIIDKLSKPSDYDENDQVTFEFEFFTGGVNPKFDSFVKRYGLTNENIQFVDFLQSDYCKEILQSNDLKIHVETGNIYTMILILTNLFLTL